MLRSSRADLGVFGGCHAFGTSMRRWGCVGRSYPSHSTSSSPAIWWERSAWREQVAPLRPQRGIGHVLVRACCVRNAQIVLANSGIFGWSRVSGCSHDSKHRAASAGLFATAGEPASFMLLMPCRRDARVPQAAAGLRPERRLRWPVRASPWYSLRSDRGCYH
jgi:hypothetical protein